MKTKPQISYQSAGMKIDPASGQVQFANQSIRLGLINMRVLTLLLEHQGQVVSRTNLFDHVWKNQLVSDDTLTRCISDLRSQLGQINPHNPLIETIPKRGYRWMPEVTHSTEQDDATPNDTTRLTKGRAKKNKRQQWTIWILSGSTTLLALTILTPWLAHRLTEPDHVRIALLPTHYESIEQKDIAIHIDQCIKKAILDTPSLRYISPSITSRNSSEPYSLFAARLSTNWIIESEIYRTKSQDYLSLNLVDSRTSLVAFSALEKLTSKLLKSDNICHTFVRQLSPQLGIEKSPE